MKTAAEHAKDICDAQHSRERNEKVIIEARDREVRAATLREAANAIESSAIVSSLLAMAERSERGE